MNTPISLEKFTELAHRTASRYSHRSELEKIAYTFLPHTLEDFHRQVCAAIEANTPAVPDLIAGALFDFIGHLTSMDESVSFGANEWATPAVELLTAFAEKRGLTLMNPAIERWHEAVAAPQPQPVQASGYGHKLMPQVSGFDTLPDDYETGDY